MQLCCFTYMLYKLLVDFGLVILIWMTQLIVYPSFTYFNPDDLVRWHDKYTTAVSIIVMPLMLGQIALHSYSLYSGFSWMTFVAFAFVILTWINTFFFAVPLHNLIAANQEVSESAQGLVRVNWYRTFLWSVVFLIGLFQYLRSQ